MDSKTPECALLPRLWVFPQLLEGNPVKRICLWNLLNASLIERPCLPDYSCSLPAITNRNALDTWFQDTLLPIFYILFPKRMPWGL
jgi:hypothetical protein